MPITDQELQRLKDDIRAVRSTMDRNRGLLREVLLPLHFRTLAILTGLAILAASGLLYWAERVYGGLQGLPLPLQLAFAGAVAAFLLASGMLKLRNQVQAARRIDPDLDYRSLIRELLRRPLVVHTLLSCLLIIAALCVFLVRHDLAGYIVALLAVMTGLVYNIYGAFTGLSLYHVPGYWFIAAGLLAVLAGPIHPLASLASSFGAGFLIFGLAIQFSGRRGE